MATDPARSVHQSAGCADDPTFTVLALVHRRSRAIIDAELHRLARRAPSLSPADLAVITSVLEDLTEAAVLVPLKNAPPDKAPLLTRIFGADENDLDGSRRTVGKTPAARSSAMLGHSRRR
ncbi:MULTISPECIES: hypothetical protein [Micromonospora]|uniref:hypothetical protein n=1 Tax=Micromonospora TaxID=1873 RepID=UPI0011B6723C|nr:hypothetical protein [Micromonospora sp. S4605]